MPHRDTNGKWLFDFVISDGSVDEPFIRENIPVTDPATLQIRPDLPPRAGLEFREQLLGGNSVV